MPDLSIFCLDGSTSFVHQLDPRIRPVKCTKELLKGRKFDIITFTTQFHKANEHLGQAIPRVVVEFFWVNEISMLYPTDHPEKRRLIGQVLNDIDRQITHDENQMLMASRRILQNMRCTGRNYSMPRPSRPREHVRALRKSGPSLGNSRRRNKKIRGSYCSEIVNGSISSQKCDSCHSTTCSSCSLLRRS